jgi:folate-binding protein YgfZ
MSTNNHVILHDRGLLKISGDDALDFLQGLVTNDVSKAKPERALYSAMLSPQGKYLYDFFIIHMNGELTIDCEAGRLGELKRKLNMYKLRSKVELIELNKDFIVAAFIGDNVADALQLNNGEGVAKSFLGGVAFIDPRISSIGGRAVIPRENAREKLTEVGFSVGNLEDYESLRLSLGLPDGSRDMVVDKAILLENGFQELNGIDWEKGCYMGQELTARTHYRGLIKKRLMPVQIEGPLPAPGTAVMFGDKNVGEMRSGNAERGLALIRLEQFKDVSKNGEGFSAEGTTLHPVKPGWAEFKFKP